MELRKFRLSVFLYMCTNSTNFLSPFTQFCFSVSSLMYRKSIKALENDLDELCHELIHVFHISFMFRVHSTSIAFFSVSIFERKIRNGFFCLRQKLFSKLSFASTRKKWAWTLNCHAIYDAITFSTLQLEKEKEEAEIYDKNSTLKMCGWMCVFWWCTTSHASGCENSTQ